ncbi:hypothetical protein [Trichococcus alkaliphilus]|uniref:hypothetical protein n=1 Tax=Trichococcus alkaliphilus TaxID=2052943 RepID=UPI000D0AFCEA|nr:hypothetical protein [Trichococcus alkaliphilus]
MDWKILFFLDCMLWAFPNNSVLSAFRNVFFIPEAHASGKGIDQQVLFFWASRFQLLGAILPKKDSLGPI